MLFLFCKNLFQIIAATRKNELVNYKNAKLVLLHKQTVPHSFFQFIFLNKEVYKNRLIEPEVLCHELTHVQQKHSLDILLIEMLITFCWFNPVLYFYRKAIRLNHEFLADEAVIKRFNNTPAYQQLLLQTATVSTQPFPASSFTYSITKKRFLMMKKNTSFQVSIAKGLTVFFLFAIAVFVFSTRTIAQVKDTTKAKRFPGREMEASKENASENVVAQFQAIVASYHLDTITQWKNYRSVITASDREQLETLYKKMSREQQQQQVIGFMPSIPPTPKNVPTIAQFEGFKNPKLYGVWVNDKKIPNTTLNQYKVSDFAQFDVSKLYGPAKAGKTYSYQVNMMTKDYYQNYYEKKMAKKDVSLMYGVWRFPNRKMEGRYVISQ